MVYTLPQIIKKSSNLFPQHDAFRFGNKSLSYTELSDKMNQLANVLIDHEVQRGDRIGVFLNRSLETAIAIYGILNAGAVFVPMDPQAPLARNRFLLADCNIQYLITNPAQKRSLKALLTEKTPLKALIGIDVDWPVTSVSWAEVFKQDKQDPAVNILESDLAYIMYTSGTTGQPKGIMHTHYSGLSYAKLSKALYDVKENDRVGNHSPLHFDISTFGYFSSPLAGATTVIISDAHTKMPASLSQLIEKEALTIWYSVPLALTQILHKGILEERDFSALRWVLFGGEPFPTKHLLSLMKRLPQAQFSNVYGPAEVNQCTYYTIPEDLEEDKPIPLGEIWDNTEMLIVNQEDQLVASGEQGELLIRSATMMSGYWKQPALTEKGFYKQKQPNSSFEHTFYRTGDLVKVDARGLLLFLGRKDRQIKTRGFRVELDEVEAAVLNLQMIQACAVFPVKNQDEGFLIEALIVLKDKLASDEKAIKDELAKVLPTYAIPHRIRFSTKIPRTAAGKVNHKLLQKQSNNLSEL